MDQKQEYEKALRENHQERMKTRTERLMRVPVIRESVTKRSKEKFERSFVEKKIYA